MILETSSTSVLDEIKSLNYEVTQGFDYEISKSFADYQIEYHGDIKFRALSHVENAKFVYILFTIDQNNNISYFSSPFIVLRSEKLDDTYFKYILVKLYKFLMLTYQPRSILGELSVALNKYYIENQVEYKHETTPYVDLKQSEEDIFRNIRKRYKSFINFGKKNFESKLITHDHPEILTEFSKFKDFHHYVSGRITRSNESWNLQKLSIKSQEAFLINTYYQGKLISSTYNILGKKTVLYGVGVYDRELMSSNLPIAHYSMFQSIQKAKLENKEFFILGRAILEELNPKETNIFRFKKGFSDTILIKPIIKVTNNV